MVVFFYIVGVLIPIFIGFILFKEYTLLRDNKKREEELSYLHLEIKGLKDSLIQSAQNNSIPNQKQDASSPKIILDNKIYSQQEFSKEIHSGNFQMSSMLQSKLDKKNKE